MKLKLFAFLLLPSVALAQTNVTVPDVTGLPLPSSKEDLWKWAIALVAPLIVTGAKTLAPRIPKLLLPISTPFIGLVLGLLLNGLGDLHLNWIDMAQAGALAVFVREVVDQATKAFTSKIVPK